MGSSRNQLSSLSALLLWSGIVSSSWTATPVESLTHSSSTTVALESVTVDDEHYAQQPLDGSPVTPTLLPGLPPAADLDALAISTNGDVLLSLDTEAVLGGPLAVAPADVLRFDGTQYSIAFDASAAGLPSQADLDCVALAVGVEALLLSFDIGLEIDGQFVDDADVILYDGVSFMTPPLFDAGTLGVAPELDVDACHALVGNRLLLSFDQPGRLGGVDFDDEDVLEYRPDTDTWEIAFDGSAYSADWVGSDLDAVHADCLTVAGLPSFTALDRTPTEVVLQWSAVAAAPAYDLVAGDLDLLRQSGDFATAGVACLANDVLGTSVTIPAAGDASWFLVRAVNGCGEGGSYASGGDGELPGRDPELAATRGACH